MKILVIGSGGREHALVWKLRQSKKVQKVFCAPGNGGMSRIAKCVNIKATESKRLAEFASTNKIDLTVVGPEQALAAGIVDEFRRRRLRIFGPDKNAARIESSKVFAKQFMQKYHIPTAAFKVFDNLAEALGFCKGIEFPVVIKVDGLAAGKGVFVVHSYAEASDTLDKIFERRIFGEAGSQIIIESCLEGQEVSVMALTDGKTIVPLLASQDHKQAFEGDRGPNTGGMGAYCPTDLVTEKIQEQIRQFVLDPVLEGFRQEKIKYSGILYAGLMLTPGGIKVLEFNCRFGDPETQVVLPMMRSDLVELMRATLDQRLEKHPKIEWRDGAAACVILASKGYPGKYQTGRKISGLHNLREEGAYVFHSGTRREDNQWLTSGGRVLGVMGLDQDLKSALDRAYRVIRRVKFDGATFRRDIGFRVLESNEETEDA